MQKPEVRSDSNTHFIPAAQQQLTHQPWDISQMSVLNCFFFTAIINCGITLKQPWLFREYCNPQYCKFPRVQRKNYRALTKLLENPENKKFSQLRCFRLLILRQIDFSNHSLLFAIPSFSSWYWNLWLSVTSWCWAPREPKKRILTS